MIKIIIVLCLVTNNKYTFTVQKHVEGLCMSIYINMAEIAINQEEDKGTSAK